MRVRSAFARFVLAASLAASPGFGSAALAQSHDAAGHARVGGATSAAQPDPSSEVFARVAMLRAELEALRLEMGKPKSEPLELEIGDAEPRQLYFQAITLFRKADRLAFEQRRERVEAPPAPETDITPDDVLRVVDDALGRIRSVNRGLSIAEPARPPPADAEPAAADVFLSILEANRQLNLLLDRQFSPSDVYAQVTLAVAYASRLLGRFPEARRIPEARAFEPRKRPAEVYLRLQGCYERVRAIARKSGLETLSLEVNPDVIERVTPSDVYDIASLVVSELDYLQRRAGAPQPLVRSFLPGRKFPSHVYQRAGVLEMQLAELEDRVGDRPAWLQAARGAP